MRALSKSKLLAYRQCPRRLWLEIHKPELREDSATSQASFVVGNQIGEIARRLYDPENSGNLINPQTEGYDSAFARTKALLASTAPIFEAGFSANGVLAFADVMLPAKINKKDKPTWHMIEVKSSTSVKDYHRDDAAIQAYVVRSTNAPVNKISLAHIDSSWVYPGDQNYQGLLVEEELTEDVFSRHDEVATWISDAQIIATSSGMPEAKTGKHCSDPFDCGFYNVCQAQEALPKYPVTWLPRLQKKAVKEMIEQGEVRDMRDLPDELLNDRQLRVKQCTLSNTIYFDGASTAKELAQHNLPGYFLDFETINFAIPIWRGTRPYQQIPFQFSLHKLSKDGKLDHQSFLDLSGNDPSLGFTESLIAACGKKGPVFVYNAGFETSRIKELADRFPQYAEQLLAINDRVVDLLPLAQHHYYHPSQQGSWSIKKVLPAIAPELNYYELEGVQDGGMAMDAFSEAISPSISEDRKDQIEQQLLKYCELDTFAMVKIWQFFSHNNNL